MWMEEYFLPNYFVETDVNGNTLDWRERLFMSDAASFRVGPARIRQLRSKLGESFKTPQPDFIY